MPLAHADVPSTAPTAADVGDHAAVAAGLPSLGFMAGVAGLCGGLAPSDAASREAPRTIAPTAGVAHEAPITALRMTNRTRSIDKH